MTPSDAPGPGAHPRPDPGTGPLLPAAVERDDPAGGWTLALTRHLRHAPAVVWSALTQPGRLARWAPFEADRDLGAEGAATLTMIDGTERTPLPTSVLRAEAPRLLEYRWGPDLLRWELEPADGGTRLTLRHTVLDPDWLPKIAAGWHLCLDVAEGVLAGEPVEPIRGAAAMDHGWPRLHEAYARELGVPVTPPERPGG